NMDQTVPRTYACSQLFRLYLKGKGNKYQFKRCTAGKSTYPKKKGINVFGDIHVQNLVHHPSKFPKSPPRSALFIFFLTCSSRLPSMSSAISSLFSFVGGAVDVALIYLPTAPTLLVLRACLSLVS